MSSERSRRFERSVTRDQYAPAYLSLIANALSWGGSRLLLRRFGVGTNEWRVLSALVNEPGSTAGQVCDVLGLNKAVVSRSINVLVSQECLTLDSGTGRRRWHLTDAGHELHDQLLTVALDREALLFTGFSQAEKDQLLGFLARMHDNLPAMNAYEPPSDPI